MDLNKLAKKLRKKYSSVEIAGENPSSKEYISTGNLGLDLALEGGIAWGYATEWAGLSGTCKSTMLQIMLADAQKKYGAYGIVIDREKSWHNERMEQMGINLDSVLVIPPQDTPQVYHATQFFEDTLPDFDDDQYVFVVVDSISAFDDPIASDKVDMGKKAGQVHRLFRRTLPMIKNRMSLNFSNHITFKSGIAFGDPRTTTSGEAPKYYTSYRLHLDDLKRIRDKDKGNEDIGNWIRTTVTKTRSGPSRRAVVFPHYFKEGIDYYGGYSRFLVDRNYIQPKNKQEFGKFEQVTVKYKDNQFSEFDIEAKLKEYPELLFNEWPEWYIEEENIIEKETDEDI